MGRLSIAVAWCPGRKGVSGVSCDMSCAVLLCGMAPVMYCAARAPENGAVCRCGDGAGMVITQSAGKRSSLPHC